MMLLCVWDENCWGFRKSPWEAKNEYSKFYKK